MSQNFKYKTALITGASSGIGRDLALNLARRGCHVGLVARREAELQALKSEIEAFGGKAAYAAADVTDAKSVKAAVTSIENELGGIELLVANAGVSIRVHSMNYDPVKIAQVYSVNVLGLNNAIAAVIGGMIKRKHGHIVGISSLASYRGLAGHSTYCGSKAAVNTQLEGLRVELRPHNVKVTTICPGYIKTPMVAHHNFKLPFMLEPTDAAQRIVRAVERGCRRYDFPWQTVLAAKVMATLPAWLYDRLPQPYSKMG